MPALRLMESKAGVALACSTAARSVQVPAAVRHWRSCGVTSGRSSVSSTEKVAACPRSRSTRQQTTATAAQIDQPMERVECVIGISPGDQWRWGLTAHQPVGVQSSPRHPLPLCGMNSTVLGKYLLDQHPEPDGASSRALNARASTYVNPIGCVAPTRSASFPTEVNNVLTRFA